MLPRGIWGGVLGVSCIVTAVVWKIGATKLAEKVQNRQAFNRKPATEEDIRQAKDNRQ